MLKSAQPINNKSRQVSGKPLASSASILTSLNAAGKQAILLAAAMLLFHQNAAGDDLAWHDHRFMQMLSNAQLNDLARIHATRHRDQSANADVKARWQQKLSELARDEIWFADGQDRSEILQHNLKSSLAIEGIQDPLLKFRLRTETSRMLQAESEAALVIAEATTLYGNQRPSKFQAATKRLQQLKAEIQRLQSTEREINGRGGPFNSQQKLKAREELRILIASLKVQKLHWLAAADASDFNQTLNSVITELESMIRSTRTERPRGQLQVLLADLAARYSTAADYELNMTPLLKEGANGRSSVIAEIQIRYRLRQRETVSAEKYLAVSSTLSRREKQKQLWLACEICVGQIEQSIRLNDAAMTASAKDRLDRLNDAMTDSGTYIDAAKRCLQKAERVLELGPELAALVEQVDRSKQNGNNEQALQQIKVALNSLSDDDVHAARPALLLIATELNIALNLWQDAIATGGSAATDFQQRGLLDKAAAADLLKCFAMAQVIPQNPEGRAEYLAALQSHTQTFTASSTSAIAVKWMLRLTSVSSPETAVQVALQRLQQTVSASERDELVTTVYEIYWQTLTSGKYEAVGQITQSQSEFFRIAAEEIKTRLQSGDVTSIAVQLINNPVSVSQISSWQQNLAKRAVRQPSVQQTFRYQLLNFVLNAKQSTVADILNQQRQQLLQQSEAELQQAFHYLARLLEKSEQQKQIQPGDIFLARTIDQLAIALLNSAARPAVVALKLLSTTAITAGMTGDDAAMQRIMAAISPDQIPAEDLKKLVPSLGQLSVRTAGQNSSMTSALRSELINFWRRLITSQPTGSDLWLEALVQLGTLSSQPEDEKELKRQFQMANVLYPEWGNEARKAQATAILERLQAVP